ncbi:MAG: ABC transporter ATP-binding protein [Clostridiales bacterium]|jgi:peptide/nickel transport system ATP-binding protein|nr:ABC transporter ATP-binding protein [Clostridiales bacterium]
MSEKVLEVKNLIVHYETQDGVAEAVNDVSFSISAGETLGLVGETGAGKTTIALTIMGLLPKPAGCVISGEVLIDGRNITETSRNRAKQRKNDRMMRRLRGNDVSMIFQDPMSALNPVMRVGDQISEVIRLHSSASRAVATQKAMEMMELVGIPGVRFKDYPHEFSGGMKQRIVIAMALACNPRVLIADEPTTALDVTIQAQVLELMNDLKRQFNTSLLMITHDLGVVAEMCDKCAVIYAGQMVEHGTVEHIFNNAQHPYTQALFSALPSLDKDVDRLKSISGLMSDPMDLPPYCTFYERCDARCHRCMELDPPLTESEPGHFVKCVHFMKDNGAPSPKEGAAAAEASL